MYILSHSDWELTDLPLPAEVSPCDSPPNGGCEHKCRINRRGIKRCGCRRNFILRNDLVSCECPAGFRLNRNGRRCVEPDSEARYSSCEINNGGCEHKCKVNRRGKVICRCYRGFVLKDDRRRCISATPCSIFNGNCEQICTNIVGRAQCSCQEDFRLLNGNSCYELSPQRKTADVRTRTKLPPSRGPLQVGCGTNNKDFLSHPVEGGKPADPKEWPWMAGILRKQTGVQFCGGALISTQHVLTAAHCLFDFKKEDLTVRLGEYDFSKPDENHATDFTVTDMKLHERYNRATEENDIAILKLDRKVVFSEFIWPVCLPPPTESYEDQLGYVIGWGSTTFGGPSSDVLQEIGIPVWEQSECEAAYPGKIVNSMMCAGERTGGKDSCQGDSGGPLVVQIYPATRWFTIGIVSWGIGCAEAEYPGVYTRVDNYLPWIKSNTIF